MIEENNLNNAAEVLKKAIEFHDEKEELDKADLDRAASLYQEAIEGILANKDIKMLIAAKQRFAEIQESRGDTKEADKLYEDIDIIIDRLELEPILEFDPSCKNKCCDGTPKKGYECKGNRTIRCRLSLSL